MSLQREKPDSVFADLRVRCAPGDPFRQHLCKRTESRY